MYIYKKEIQNSELDCRKTDEIDYYQIPTGTGSVESTVVPDFDSPRQGWNMVCLVRLSQKSQRSF